MTLHQIEVSLARSNENTLSNQIQAEVVDRMYADANFQSALASETLTRSTADTKQASDLSFEVARSQAYESVLNTSINTEKSRAEGIEAGLRTDLTKEIADRVNALISEAGLRSGSDLAIIATQLSESKRLDVADTTNYNALNTAIAYEASRALTKENSLQNQINFFVANVDPIAMDSLAEIVSKLNSAGSDLYQRVLYLEQVVSTLRGQELYAVVQPVYTPGVVPSNP